MNLEQLRKRAKDLVRAARAGDEDALTRLNGREPTLAHAHLVLAREHGYPSWPALVAAADADAESFVLAGTGRRATRAEAMLGNERFVANAPSAVVEAERAKLERFGRELAALEGSES